VPFENRESSVRVLMRHVSEAPPLVTDLRPRVDPELSDWVAALLAKEPSDRPASAAAARDRLEDIVLGLRGARWRREAALPLRAGGTSAAAAALQSPAGRSPTAIAPPTAPGRLSDDRTRGARRPPPPAAAVRDDTAALASPRGARRMPRAATLALVAGIAAAAISVGAKGIGGGAPGRADPAVQVSRAQPVASPAGGPAAATATPAGTTAAPATIDPARVVDAERESRRFADEAQDTEGDGDEALTQQLRDTQYAYRDAAAAAAAGDTGRFTTTLAKADALARAALARLDGDGSDDSSDEDEDEPDEDENDEDGGDEGGGA
jgi:hypothetical protein